MKVANIFGLVLMILATIFIMLAFLMPMLNPEGEGLDAGTLIAVFIIWIIAIIIGAVAVDQ